MLRWMGLLLATGALKDLINGVDGSDIGAAGADTALDPTSRCVGRAVPAKKTASADDIFNFVRFGRS
jgi:hypothetical protein